MTGNGRRTGKQRRRRRTGRAVGLRLAGGALALALAVAGCSGRSGTGTGSGHSGTGSGPSGSAARPAASGSTPAPGTGSAPGGTPGPQTPAAALRAAMSGAADCPKPVPGFLTQTPATLPRTVALTFDDGPSQWTPQFVAVLARYHVHGTFFMVASRAVSQPDVVRQVVAAGDLIGNHTWSHPLHPGLNLLPPAVVATQIADAEVMLTRLSGDRPCFFRAPGEDHRTSYVQGIAHQFGLTVVDVTRTAGDANNPLNAHWNPAWTNRIVSQLTAAGDHPILLIHDGHADNKVNELSALARIIVWYQQRGYVFTDPLGQPFR